MESASSTAAITQPPKAWRAAMLQLRKIERLQLLTTAGMGLVSIGLTILLAIGIASTLSESRRALEARDGIEAFQRDARQLQADQFLYRLDGGGGGMPDIAERFSALRVIVRDMPVLSETPSGEPELRRRVLDTLGIIAGIAALSPSDIKLGSEVDRRAWAATRPVMNELDRLQREWASSVRAASSRQLDQNTAQVRRLAAGLLIALVILVGTVLLIALRLQRIRLGLSNDLETSAQELERLSQTDTLTNLPNRRAFRDAAVLAAAEGGPLSLAIIDIDHFKRVNDTLGHDAGDQVLVDFAELLIELPADGQLVARLGGEEFGWLMPGVAPDEAERLVGRIHEQLAREGRISVSCGVAHAPSGADVQTLLGSADRALYEAKATGRNRTIVDRGTPSADSPSLRLAAGDSTLSVDALEPRNG